MAWVRMVAVGFAGVSVALAGTAPGERPVRPERRVESRQRPAERSPTRLDPQRLVKDARAQIGVTTSYDPAYRLMDFPLGDLPQSTGVCSDVVIRALREQGFDLQQAVHDDMGRKFGAYPRTWGLKGRDRNIDHRRVFNLETYFTRQGWRVPLKAGRPLTPQPGDIVTWMMPNNQGHIGIASDRTVAGTTVPLILHNIGTGTQEEGVLFAFPLRGIFRIPAVQRGEATPVR